MSRWDWNSSNEIIAEIARFIVLGLPPGGFSSSVLRGEEDIAVVRYRLHRLYSDEMMHDLIEFIDDRSLGLFQGTNLADWKGLDDPRSNDHIASMLKLNSTFWVDVARETDPRDMERLDSSR